MSSDIPRAREMIGELIADINLGKMRPVDVVGVLTNTVLPLMTREHNKPVSKSKRRRMTNELADEVRAFANDNPGMSCDEIGKRFNIAGGRVSEAIAGKRYKEGRVDKNAGAQL